MFIAVLRHFCGVLVLALVLQAIVLDVLTLLRVL